MKKKIIDTKQIKLGAMLAYVLIAINALYGLFLTPYILSKLGQSDFGVYKTISAFTSSLMVLDLGLGGTVMRYVAKFKADKKESEISNFVSMCFIQAGIIIAVLSVVMICLYFSLDNIYRSGLSLSELAKAKQLYIFLCFGVFVNIIENVTNGVIAGYNKFVFSNGIKLIRIIFRILLLIILLNIFADSIVIVLIDLAVTLSAIIAEFLFIKYKLHNRIKYNHWENGLFVDSFKYTILMFITTVAAQVNSNLDNVVIGAVINAEAVTVYSMGLLIFAMFEQFSTAISSVLLPTITNILASDDSMYSKTQEFIVKVGRIQFSLLGAAFAGFIIIGKQFVQAWLGNSYNDVYYIAVILMGPALFELCVNGCLAVLRAENKLGFRTIILLFTTLVNAAITIIGTSLWNYFAAAIGTAFSFLVGSVLIMNIYYIKKLKFNILRIYSQIFSKTWVCIVVSGASCLTASAFIKDSLISFIIGLLAFVGVYAISMLTYGFSNEEKNMLHLNKFIGGKKID